MRSLISSANYKKQANIVQLHVQKGQISKMHSQISCWLKEEHYDIQQEYIVGLLPVDIYASSARGAAVPIKFIVECNGYHHYCCNTLDTVAELGGDKMSDDIFESVHDSLFQPAPEDIFKLLYKQKKAEVPIICISIAMYNRGKEYLMGYIRRKITPPSEKDLSQPLLGMAKMGLFAPPPAGLSTDTGPSTEGSSILSPHCK